MRSGGSDSSRRANFSVPLEEFAGVDVALPPLAIPLALKHSPYLLSIGGKGGHLGVFRGVFAEHAQGEAGFGVEVAGVHGTPALKRIRGVVGESGGGPLSVVAGAEGQAFKRAVQAFGRECAVPAEHVLLLFGEGFRALALPLVARFVALPLLRGEHRERASLCGGEQYQGDGSGPMMFPVHGISSPPIRRLRSRRVRAGGRAT